MEVGGAERGRGRECWRKHLYAWYFAGLFIFCNYYNVVFSAGDVPSGGREQGPHPEDDPFPARYVGVVRRGGDPTHRMIPYLPGM